MTAISERLDPYLSEILEQPAALRRAGHAVVAQVAQLRTLTALREANPRIVLTGMGSSFDACLAAASILAGMGVMPTTVNASELLHFRRNALGPGCLLLIVSQSGRSAEIVRLADTSDGISRPAIVSITNGLDNPLASASDVAFDMEVGPERGPATMTFAASLVVLAALVEILGRNRSKDIEAVSTLVADRADRASRAAERLLADHRDHADELQTWLGHRSLVILGRGTARAAAEVGALSLKEAGGYPAEALDTAEFRHGPLELAGPDLAAVVISLEASTRPLDHALCEELSAFGTRVLVVGGGPAPRGARFIAIGDIHRSLAPSVAAIPLQLLAWRIATARARRPGEFTRGSKITTRE